MDQTGDGEMDFEKRRFLGKTGLSVGRLGVGSSYGAPTEAYEEAFERGINYFYWGSLRKASMARAIRNILSSTLSALNPFKYDQFTHIPWAPRKS
jgi:hypothetical protein